MKKIIRTAALLLTFLSVSFLFCPVQASASENTAVNPAEAERVRLNVSCDLLPGQNLSSVVDNNIYTFFYANQPRIRFKFFPEKPVRQLYVTFEHPCLWTLILPDGTERQEGVDGFIHNYIALDEAIESFEIEITRETKLTDVVSFTDGNLPDWVQTWQPPCQKADLMVMPTHADDEYLWFGGAIPYYAGELGYNVQVVYMTHHYKDSPRAHELLNGLWKMGVRNYPIISSEFQDDRVAKSSNFAAEAFYGHDKVLEFQVETLRRFSPKVIIAHDIKGEYGHGAHILNATTLLEALEIYEDPSVYPESAEKYGTEKIGKCYLHLWEENPIVVQWSDKKLERFEGRTAFDMAAEGFACHRSQQGFGLNVEEDGKFDCRLFGLAYTTVGYDTPGLNDMFEHIDMTENKSVDADGKKNNTVSGSDASVTDPDMDSETDPTEEKSAITLFGNSLPLIGIAMAATAVLITAIALPVVICLRKRRIMHKSRDSAA